MWLLLTFSLSLTCLLEDFLDLDLFFVFSVFLRLMVFHTDTLFLMAVAVSFLGKALVAVLTHEWSDAAVHTDVVHHVA